MPLSNIVKKNKASSGNGGTFEPFAVPTNLIHEMTSAEKAEKERRENPTVDENGEHIQTVAEAKLEAAAL